MENFICCVVYLFQIELEFKYQKYAVKGFTLAKLQLLICKLN